MTIQTKTIAHPITTPDERALAAHELTAARNDGWRVLTSWQRKGTLYVIVERETDAIVPALPADVIEAYEHAHASGNGEDPARWRDALGTLFDVVGDHMPAPVQEETSDD